VVAVAVVVMVMALLFVLMASSPCRTGKRPRIIKARRGQRQHDGRFLSRLLAFVRYLHFTASCTLFT
jgi:hypothetical protein